MRRQLIWWLLRRDEREALIRLRRSTIESHYVDLAVRRNGESRAFQADYLKALTRLVTPAQTWARISTERS